MTLSNVEKVCRTVERRERHDNYVTVEARAIAELAHRLAALEQRLAQAESVTDPLRPLGGSHA